MDSYGEIPVTLCSYYDGQLFGERGAADNDSNAAPRKNSIIIKRWLLFSEQKRKFCYARAARAAHQLGVQGQSRPARDSRIFCVNE